MSRSYLVPLFVACLAWLAPQVQSAETDAQNSRTLASSATNPAELTELIRQLGADSFETREEAGRKLSARGVSAIGALKSGVDHPDVEVRTRCRRILASVLTVDFENRMQAFLDDKDNKQEHKLPGWNRYRKVIGEDKTSRQLFVEMLRTESDLLNAAENAPKTAGDKLTVACREMQQQLYGRGGQQPLTMGSAATVFFVGSDPLVAVNDQTTAMLYQFVHQPTFQQALTGGPRTEQARKLLGAWIGTRTSTNTAYQGMMLAMQYNLKEGLVPALALMKNADVNQKAYAMVGVGKLGSREQLPVLEGLLEDTSACGASQVNGNRIPIETRDIALAMLVHLTGQNLKDYGFDRAQPNQQYLFVPYSLGFADTAKRDAGIKKWRDWKSEQKKP